MHQALRNAAETSVAQTGSAEGIAVLLERPPRRATSGKRRLLQILVAALVLPASLAQGQNALSEQEFLDYLRSLSQPAGNSEPSAALQRRMSTLGLGMMAVPPPNVSTFGINSGFGLPGGSMFAAGAITDVRDRVQGSSMDGSGAVGLGFGDASQSIGADLSVGILSVDPNDFGEDGNVSARVFRQLPGFGSSGISSVALGVANAASWGSAKNIDSNYFIAGSTIIDISLSASGYLPLMLSAGYGTGVKNLERDPAGFFGAGIGFTSRFSASTSWSGDEVMVGLGIRPFLRYNSQITLGMGDVTNRLDGRRWIITGYWFWEDLF
ncbi:hypothetical protein MIH18_06970 [Marinobacter sp. M3C]|jgi:hypothetical protein|uniref:hypothetical protein n=1 Tax=unclassified Marinobacter TaxID=83889 RepID=UPI00200BC503|nr:MULTISPECIES: hypothetical protein [unclassified Marinobacter]MCL1479062.1 hypothetical protein [Marinobacter sp.]MCL1488970.1 hypothetical protein [Marinobacter sp.]UQG57140.1 hypothetical protein MIH16_05700 [Marinobacter sp. M4C]UQG61678.1 hypothetical protein MIH18_06970 [Marinobacter sp. M3C]UQG65944.1 hypothetical protein MIH17_05700 [Marinobacter sp. M2C]